MCLRFHVLRFYCCICCLDLCSQFGFDFMAGMVGNVSADAGACSSWGAMVVDVMFWGSELKDGSMLMSKHLVPHADTETFSV